MEHYDLIVIGAGSGGMKAAKLAAELGKKVVVIESGAVGGTCVNRGCMPKKMIFLSAQLKRVLQNPAVANLGWSPSNSSFSWPQLTATVERIVQQLSKKNTQRLTDKEIPIIYGAAKFVTKNRLAISGGAEISGDAILIAVGGEPNRPQMEGAELIISSDQFFSMEQLPKKLLLVGGGYIAIEFACMMNALGSEVTLLHRNRDLLREFDREAVALLAEQMQRGGINILLDDQITKVEKQGEQLLAYLSQGKKLLVDKIVAAIGRKPRTAGLGLEKVGVKLRADLSLVVDEQQQTSQPGIFAVGDVTGELALTPVAARQAELLIAGLYRGQKGRLKYEYVPKAVFSLPQLACVGWTEAEAKRHCSGVKVYRNSLVSLQNSLLGIKQKSLFKVVTCDHDARVVGVHILADEAAEMIQIAAIAMNSELTKAEFDETIKLHPTIAEELLFVEA